MRKPGFSRHLTLLASVALAFGLIPNVAAAEGAEPTNPYVGVAPDGDSMWGGSGWAPGNSIDITIDDPTGDADYSTTITVEPSEQGDDWRLELGGVFDIQPGQFVTVTDAVADITKTHEVRNFTVDLVNTDSDTVEGTAPPSVELRVKILEPESCDTTATADGSGFWTASFAGLLSQGGQPCNIQAGWAGSAEWPDEGDNDVTFMGWGVGGGGDPLIVVTVNARDWWDEPSGTLLNGYLLESWFWPEGESVSIKVRDPSGTQVYSDSIVVGESIFNHATSDQFALVVPTSVGLVAGFEIEASSQSVGPMILVVQDVAVSGYDLEANTVWGTGIAGGEVAGIHVAGFEYAADAWGPFPVDTGGLWGPVDVRAINPLIELVPGVSVSARMEGPNGYTTEYEVSIPNPYFSVNPDFDSVWGNDWIATSVTITVDDLDTTENPDYVSDPVPVASWGEAPWEVGFRTDIGFDIEPDHVVTVTDGVSTKVHAVTALTVDGVDDENDLVFGHAEPSSEVQVALWGTETDPHVERVVSADETGYWYADFSTAIGPDGWQQDRDVTLDSQGGAWQSDDDGDTTQIDFGPDDGDGGDGEPFLHANAYGDEFVHGNNFDSDELRVIEITNDPACTGRVYTNEWEWQYDGSQFCLDGDLKPGHQVTISTVLDDGVTPGDIIRELVIHDVVITGADTGDDSVSGLATGGSPVLVGIAAEPGSPFSFDAQRVVDPNENGEWTVSFNDSPTGDPEDNWGQMEIDGQEAVAFQFDEDGDFTTSDWRELDTRVFVNVLEDFVMLQGWLADTPIVVDVLESDTDGAPLLYREFIDPPGPYYRFETQTDLGGIDLLSGNHVVASNGIVELSHTVTELAITSFDFADDSFTGTAFAGTTVAAGAWNDTSEGEVGALRELLNWTANFTGQVDFSEYNRIGGFVAEFDDAQNATFFMFEAEYVELVVGSGETSVTTEDGSITVDNLGQGDSIEIITGPSSGSSGGFEYVGETVEIISDEPARSWDNPLILTLHILGEEIPPDLDLDDIVVFKDGVEVPNCVLPLDSDDDFPCVSERIRFEATGDIELTVQTLEFSVWTMAFRSVTIAAFESTSEPVEIGTEVMATGGLVDVGKTQATGLTATVSWGDDTCEVVLIENDGVTALHTYGEAGVFTVAFRLYAGSAGDCANVESLELIDDATFSYVVVYGPSGGFVTGGGWIDSDAGSYLPDPTLEGKASFGFVSKYKKGATVPTGNTEFQFHAGDLNFNSSSYDWLVVTGSGYARFKGVGAINGQGEYKFMIWAGDKDPDTFRIKIWTEDEFGAETIVYDNGYDQAIGGGSIVIHTKKE